MKKKLKLNDLKVKSFVTDVADKSDVKGGQKGGPTELSCYRYVSCFQFQCITRDEGKFCKI